MLQSAREAVNLSDGDGIQIVIVNEMLSKMADNTFLFALSLYLPI